MLAKLLNDIQGGRWQTGIGQARKSATKLEAGKLKGNLPAVKFSGVFRGLSAADLIRHSGLLMLDVDGVPIQARRGLRLTFADDPHVLAFFTSPSGNGLKIIVPVRANDAHTHRLCFDASKAHFKPLLPSGAVLDQQPLSVAGNCFVSHDPDLWRATEPRAVFQASTETGKVEDMSPHSPPQAADEEKIPSHKTIGQPHIYGTPPAPGFPLPGVVDATIWANWLKRVPHRPSARNATIKERAPLLLNLVAPENAAWLLLRWFDQAPARLFSASRDDHWRETLAAIKGCLESWPANRKVGLNVAEREAYRTLRDDRQRDSFRICRSLSLANDNKATRRFFLSDKQLGDRLACDSRSAARQLEYLANREIIRITAKGTEWKKGMGIKPQAARYQWLLA